MGSQHLSRRALGQPVVPTSPLLFRQQRHQRAVAQDTKDQCREHSGAPLPKAKSKSAPKKTPPNPPITKCTQWKDFSYRGSTACTVKATCRDCGHSTTTRRDEKYAYTFENCPHEVVDRRGSSKATSPWRLLEHEVPSWHGAPVAKGSCVLVVILQRPAPSSRYKSLRLTLS